MPTVLPIDHTRVRQADERFVHERGGLEGVAGPLAPHVVRGLASQFGVEHGRHLPIRVLVACMPGAQQGGDFTNRGILHSGRRQAV